jgi:hypothetical protein
MNHYLSNRRIGLSLEFVCLFKHIASVNFTGAFVVIKCIVPSLLMAIIFVHALVTPLIFRPLHLILYCTFLPNDSVSRCNAGEPS